ncbi:MAG: hypothetical protein AAGJ31_05955, partial [Verrucomicrobiota bacterium]
VASLVHRLENYRYTSRGYSHEFKATTKERSELRDCVGNAEITREDRALWQIASENEPFERK